MQVSCLKRKPNMVVGAKGDTREVVGQPGYFSIILGIQIQQTSGTRYHVLGLPIS